MNRTFLAALVALALLVPNVVSGQPTGAPGTPSGNPGRYLVVELALGGESEFASSARAVAREVAEFHRGEVISFDGKDWDAWRRTLQEKRPDNVLFVVAPDVIDVPLHRRILLASADLDEDPLPDFAWGYFTAADGAQLAALWQRTKRVHTRGLDGRTWYDVAVTSGMKSRVYPGHVPTLAKAAGFTGDSIYFATVDADDENLEFVDAQLPRLEEASVVEFTGNGDPEGIWLFPGRRNMDRSLHWDFDPARVGEDPEGEMPRVTAPRFANLELNAPVVWSGTCHSAATHRVFVEGDIVSTFGRTDKTTLYEMPAERSICLALLKAGAVAFLAPIGANHGMSVSRERDAAIGRGCSLGEAIKSTWDDVFLAAGGPPKLDIPVDGDPHQYGEPVMQGGGSNRILIGDPALRPFEATPHPGESIVITKVKNGFNVTVIWEAGWHPMAWDMFGTVRGKDWRVVARVPIGDVIGSGKPVPQWNVGVGATGDDGEAMPYSLRHAVVEEWRGERYLHLQASGPREEIERKGVTVVFRVRW